MSCNKISISVIIPVYNALPFLDECLASILNQSFQQWEAICVDDCSTDESYFELLKYSQQDSRIKVFQMDKNAGAGPTRNLGLENAKGKYILFMDPDDYYPNDTVFWELFDLIEKTNVNIAGGNITTTNEANRSNLHPFRDCGLLLTTGYASSYYFQRFIYSRDLLVKNNLTFPSYRRGEDPVFLANVLITNEYINCLSKNVYVYRVNHKKTVYTNSVIINLLSSHNDCLIIFKQNNFKKAYNNEVDLIVYLIIRQVIPLCFKQIFKVKSNYHLLIATFQLLCCCGFSFLVKTCMKIFRKFVKKVPYGKNKCNSSCS